MACPNSLACAPSGTACLTACVANTDCAGTNTNFCDPSTGSCCRHINNNGALSVDNGNGSDATACCGYGTAGACQTLTEAMRLVDGTNSIRPGSLVTVNALVNGAGGDWKTGENYPISLDWGVTLVAPGVYFTDPNGNAEIFDVALHAGEDAGNAITIQGGFGAMFQALPIVIGSDSDANVTTDATSVVVETGATLDMSYAYVYEGIGNTGIDVQTGATLNIVPGDPGLDLGAGLPSGAAFTSTFGTGILCKGTIGDTGASAVNPFVASSQDVSIDAEDNCAVNLTASWFGSGPYASGFTNAGAGCAAKPDNTAIWADGVGAVITLNNPNISCMNDYGIKVTNSSNGLLPPTVTITANEALSVPWPKIHECSKAGVFANAGTVYLEETSIYDNFIGVDMESDANGNSPTIYLNSGTSSVYCNSNQETGGHSPGMDVYNNSTGALFVDALTWSYWFQPNGDANAKWWPDTFYCDDALECICVSVDSSGASQCMNTGYSPDGGTAPDGMNLVLGTGTGSAPFGTYNLGLQASTDGVASGLCQ